MLVVNSEYQRGGRLWPPAAKSYFIDTMISKIFLSRRFIFTKRLRRKRRPRVERSSTGSNRIGTIVDFVDGKFALGKKRQGVPRVEISPVVRRSAGFLLLVHGVRRRHPER